MLKIDKTGVSTSKRDYIRMFLPSLASVMAARPCFCSFLLFVVEVPANFVETVKRAITCSVPRVTASSYRSLKALTEVEEPAGMGESLVTGAHRHRSILPPGVKYVPGPRVLRRILSNRSQSLIAKSNGHLSGSLKTTA